MAAEAIEQQGTGETVPRAYLNQEYAVCSAAPPNNRGRQWNAYAKVPTIVSAISTNRFPLGCTLRTDMKPLLRAPTSFLLAEGADLTRWLSEEAVDGMTHCTTQLPDCPVEPSLPVDRYSPRSVSRSSQNHNAEIRDADRVGSKLCTLDHGRLRDSRDRPIGGISGLGQQPLRYLDGDPTER